MCEPLTFYPACVINERLPGATVIPKHQKPEELDKSEEDASAAYFTRPVLLVFLKIMAFIGVCRALLYLLVSRLN